MTALQCPRCFIEARIANFRAVEQELQSPYAGATPGELEMARRAYNVALEMLPDFQHDNPQGQPCQPRR